MRNLKIVVLIVLALLPILYCIRILFFLVDKTGSIDNAVAFGLGPTLLGLGGIGLIFCILLAVRLVRLFGGPRSPDPDAPRRPDPSAGGGDGRFDADAAVARYLAARPVEAGPRTAAASPVPNGGGPARPQGFGRRGR